MVLDPAWNHRFVLDHGLTVLLKEQHASPVVAFQAWVGVGSADEPEDLAGIAHVFEHMLFKGTARRGVGQIAREVEAAGGDINAWTSFDQTVYHLVLGSRFFDTGLDIVTDALRNSSFDPEELARELKVVLEEVKQGEDSPGRVVTQSLFASAFTQHAYRRPVIGYTRTVENFKRKSLLEFFRRYYVPNNITLVVVGDFEAAVARKKIEAAWKGARRRELPAPVVGGRSEPAQKKMRVTVAGSAISDVHLVAAFHVPNLRHPDTAALDVGAIILGQGDSSRLQREIKRGRQVVSEAYAYSFTPRDPGLMVVGATLPPERTDEALAALMAEAFRLVHEDVTTEELAKAQAIIESDAVYQKETVQGMARKLGFFETVAGSLAYEDEYLAQTRSVTAASLREAMARYLRPENCTLAVLLPAGSEALAGRAAQKAFDGKLRAIVAKAALPPTVSKAAAKKKALVAARGPARPSVVREVLPSGLRVLVLRDPSVPLVAMRAAWLGGLRYETPADNGVTNLLGALITRGTSSRSGDEIAHEIESLAGGIGGFSGRNSFGVRAEVMSRHFDHGLGVLADCILHPSFPEEELAHEKRQALEEIRTQEDNISSVTFRLFSQSLYRKHPYRMDMLGTPDSLAGLDRQRLAAWYANHYAPSGMTIAIVGDVDPAEVVADVSRLFDGATKVGRAASPPAPALDEPHTSAVRVHRYLSKQQAHLVVGFPGTTIGHADRFPLEVLSTILSGQGGRLFVELREKRGLAYRVSAFTLDGIDPGYFAVYVATSPENLSVAEAAILAELRKIVEKGVPQAELARARTYLAGSHDISLQRRSALAATLAFNECYGLGWDQYLRYAESILAVTAADLRRVAATYLDLSRSVTAYVLPEEVAHRKEPPAVPPREHARAARAPKPRSDHNRG